MKLNINDLSKFTELKTVLLDKGVSRATIDTLNNALARGLVVKGEADLSLLSIPAAELSLVSSSVTFGASQPEPQDFRTVQFTFHPVDTATGNSGPSVDDHFFGYQLVVTYTNKKQYTIEEAYPIESSRLVIVDVDLNDVMDREIIYRVKSPQGEFALIDFKSSTGIASKESLSTSKADLKNAEIKVSVDVLPPFVNITAAKSYQIKGRVISQNSESKLEKFQIVILASVADLPDGNPEFIPSAYAITETGGYFVTSFLMLSDPDDLTRIKNAKAIVAKNDFQTEIPIKLVVTKKIIASPDGETTVVSTSIPERLIFVIDEADVDKSEGKNCGCGDLNFHEKKVFEEFSYQTVVRTTEPAIVADVIEEDEEIDLGDIYGDTVRGTHVPYKVFTKFHEIKTRQLPVQKANGNAAISAATNGMLANVSRSALTAARVVEPSPSRSPFTDFDARLLNSLLTDYRTEQTVKANQPRINKGRAYLTPLNQINWDKATIYQAASIAHGHLLHFKQEWVPDGYSIGDLLYSLPLAPGQKKQIAVLDWERRESAANSQSLNYEESLNNSLIRDRDVSEVVSATLSEHLHGTSTARTGGFGGGYGSAATGIINGISFGSVLGISGGKSKSNTTATQDSSRESTANSLQSIRDRTTQAASVVRSQRSTVIQTVSQGERVQATSESVANYNHCHAITIEYFEVLRHFSVHNRFVGAQECLFIPLQITNFDLEKALRWRNTLEKCIVRPDLLRAFDALERIKNERESAAENYYDSLGYPRDNYAEQDITDLQGEMFVEFYFFNTKESIDTPLIEFYKKFFRVDLNEYKDRRLTDQELSRIVGPRTVEHLLDALVIETDTGANLNLDVTLITPFRQNARLQISLRSKGPVNIPRWAVKGVKIRFDESKVRANDATDIRQFTDMYMKILVRSGSLRYRTRNFAGTLFDAQLDNDLFVGTDAVFVTTPLNNEELRNPRGEDVNAANNLIHHLNENLEHYHKCVWFNMTDERLFMLLDGIVAPGKAKGRSVASVVENRIIGIAGNSLIMPVAPGNQLDPTIDDQVDLKARYYEEDREPMRITLPTKGVYAEAVIGKCNSCEEKDESRFWRWEESPIPDSPSTQIMPLNTDTRRAEPGNLQPKDFPSPVVNIQNAPNLPDPAGLQNVLQAVGKADAFRDLTGLNQNQLSALATYQKALDTAQSFGKEAAELAKIMATVQMAKDAQKSGALSNEDTKEIVKQELKKPDPEKVREETKEDLKTIEEAKQKNQIDDAQAKEMSEDVTRKRQGTTKPAASVPTKGKRKINLTLMIKDVDGNRLVGTWVLTYGSIVERQFESTDPFIQFEVELDTARPNILHLKGNPYLTGLSFPPDAEFYYHEATVPTKLGATSNLVIEFSQDFVVRSVTHSKSATDSEIFTHAAAQESGTQSEVGGETGALQRLLMGKIAGKASFFGKRTETDTGTGGHEEGTTQTVTTPVKLPGRALKYKRLDDGE